MFAIVVFEARAGHVWGWAGNIDGRLMSWGALLEECSVKYKFEKIS